MTNLFTIIGRVKENTPIKTNRKGEKFIKATISTTRPFKNEDGEYKDDYINVILRGKVATMFVYYLHVKDLIGIKGHIESTERGTTILVGDKISFLSSTPPKEVE